jgi:murein L,D-transpeptidase YafK
MNLMQLLRTASLAAALVGIAGLAGCGQVIDSVPAAMQPLSQNAMHLLGKKGMSAKSAMFVRIFKEESELEVWKQRDDGHFYHFKTYPICTWSGDLGPKRVEGDYQSPEGFYSVGRSQMNPNSKYHLSFNVGYPNAYDKAYGGTGAALMVHGDCRSAGCYAMTDALIEEIFVLAREAFDGGQEKFALHIYPFRMTAAKMKAHKGSTWEPFWKQLKQGYDYFEQTKTTPEVAVCNKRYVVAPAWDAPVGGLDPSGPCPSFHQAKIVPFVAKTDTASLDPAMSLAPGKKTRDLALEGLQGGSTGFGLTKVLTDPFAGFGGSSEKSKSGFSVLDVLTKH